MLAPEDSQQTPLITIETPSRNTLVKQVDSLTVVVKCSSAEEAKGGR